MSLQIDPLPGSEPQGGGRASGAAQEAAVVESRPSVIYGCCHVRCCETQVLSIVGELVLGSLELLCLASLHGRLLQVHQLCGSQPFDEA